MQGHGKVTGMTRQESFKRRVRARMAHTGERYAAARRYLVAQAPAPAPAPGAAAAEAPHRRVWTADPGMADHRLVAATGRGWDEWCDLIAGWPGHTAGHTAVAAHLQSDHGVDAITVLRRATREYEGLRDAERVGGAKSVAQNGGARTGRAGSPGGGGVT